MNRIQSSRFTSKTDNRPTLAEVHLPDFIAAPLLGAKAKDGLPLWSPATFTNGRRCKAHVVSVRAFVIDVDSGNDDLPAFIAKLAAALPVTWFVHSSFSASHERPKFRAIATVSRPILALEFPNVFRAVAHALSLGGVEIDRACSDASRAFFVPALPPSGYYVHSTCCTKEALDVDLWHAFGVRLVRDLPPRKEAV